MKQSWVNDIEGIGQAEVSDCGQLKECRGVFIPSNPTKAISATLEDTAQFRGVVIENGRETICEFPIIITKSTIGSSGDRMLFVATGNPYDGEVET